MLDTPLVDATPGGASIRWSPDLTARAVPATDYRHLNLLLRPGSTLRWTVTLPPGT